jgi:hypothetical protein
MFGRQSSVPIWPRKRTVVVLLFLLMAGNVTRFHTTKIKHLTTMATMIPREVFVGGLILSAPLYLVCLVWYYIRGDHFPIKQLAPVNLVIVLHVVVGTSGTVIVLSDAFPSDPVLSGCTSLMYSLSFFLYCLLILITYGVVWVCRRDALIKLRLQNQQQWFGFTLVDVEMSTAKLTTYLPLFLEDMLLKMFERIGEHRLFACFSGFFMLCAIGDCALISTYVERMAGVQVHDVECYPLIRIGIAYKIILLVVVTCVSILIWGILLHLKDNFGIRGLAFRVSLFLGAAVIFIALNLVPNAAQVLLFDTRAWGFCIGLIFIPGIFISFGYYYIWQTYRNEREVEPSQPLDNSLSPNAVPTVRVQLGVVLSDSNGKKLLQNFMTSEYSLENLMFVEACSAFEQAVQSPSSDKDLGNIATSIMDNFIKDSGQFTVNISFKKRKELTDNFEDVLEKLNVEKKEDISKFFDAAKEEVLVMIAKDTFTRFKLTKEYLDWADLGQTTSTLMQDW